MNLQGVEQGQAFLSADEQERLYERDDTPPDSIASMVLSCGRSRASAGDSYMACQNAAQVLCGTLSVSDPSSDYLGVRRDSHIQAQVGSLRSNLRQQKESGALLTLHVPIALDDAIRVLRSPQTSTADKEAAMGQVFRLRVLTILGAAAAGFRDHPMAPNRNEAHDLLDVWKIACRALGADPVVLMRNAMSEINNNAPNALAALARAEARACLGRFQIVTPPGPGFEGAGTR